MSDVAVKPNWEFPFQLKSVPGGRIHRANGKFEDAWGNSLDPADHKPRLLKEIADAQAKLAALEADVKAAELAELTKETDKADPIVVAKVGK